MFSRMVFIIALLAAAPTSLQEVFTNCQINLVCRLAYPNLQERYHALRTRLDADPVEVEGVIITGAMFAEGLEALSAQSPGNVPAVIAAVEAGDGTILLATLQAVNAPPTPSDSVSPLAIPAEVVQPVGSVLGVALGMFSVLLLGFLLVRSVGMLGHFAWAQALQRTHWLPAVGSLALIITLIAIWASNGDHGLLHTAVEIVIPLVIALQAAMLFVPQTEPAIEIQAASQRPIHWVPLERLFLVFGLQTVSAILGVGLIAVLAPEETIALALTRWLPAALFLSSIAFVLTIHTGEVALGTVFVALFWGIMLAFGDLLLPPPALQPAQPFPVNIASAFVWMIHVYLQPDDLGSTLYLINRAILLGTGCMLYAAAFQRIGHIEKLLAK
ncbi:MAG: hypothetical protein ACFB51_12765 [Anaerolineae bacterium]